VPLSALASLQQEYVSEATQLWNQTVARLAAGDGAKPAAPRDKRFAGDAWAANPAAAHLAQMYLLNARTLLRLAESVEGNEKTRQRIRFAVQQWVDAASPSNFLATNPEAQRKAIETGGESIALGLRHLWHDVRQGHMSQTDESQFEVGRNVAATPGSVVFENELFQLIEYAPTTPTVFERPFLIVPPCINKFYILDLQPENSLVRHAVAEGHTVFLVSWCNPDASLGKLGWDDYIEEAAITAIHTVQQISEQEKINVLGFCVGGTILSTALAVLAARGEHPASGLTLLTSLLDFSDTGILDVYIDEAQVAMREQSIGHGGLMPGRDFASAFSSLRPNDLVWNYVKTNYLKGEFPPAFDLLYWNGDSTNLPGPMFCWYLRNLYLEDSLKVPGKLTVAGNKVDLATIDTPAFIYASREDHIVPWTAAYASTYLLNPKDTQQNRFVLGASGHIAGVINPPAKKKRSYWINDSLPSQAEEWFEGATECPGSWWTEWTSFLAEHAGEEIKAPNKQGSKKHPPIEAAPGRYVKVKAE